MDEVYGPCYWAFSQIKTASESRDDDYGIFLRQLEEDDKSYGVVAEREKSMELKKRKRKGSVMEQLNDSQIGEIDPQFELYLRLLKERDKPCVFGSKQNRPPSAKKCKNRMVEDGADGKEQDLHQKHTRMKNCVAENLCERVYPAQTGVQSQRKLKKVAGYSTVVKGEHESYKRAEIQLHKEHSHHHSSPGNDKLQKNQSCAAQIGEKNKVQYRLERDDERLYQGSSRLANDGDKYEKSSRSKRAKEFQLEHANKAPSVKAEKVRGRPRKKAVGKDGASKLIHSDNDHFHHKRMIQEKILPEKYGRKHANKARPVDERAEIQLHKEHFDHHSSPGDDMLVKNQFCHRCVAQIDEKNEVRKRLERDNKRLYRPLDQESSSRRSKRVKECPLEHATKAQSGKVEKVRGRPRKKAVGKDGASKLIHSDNGHFHHKRMIQEKILSEKHGREHGDKARPIEKYKGQRGGKLKGVIKQEVKEEIYQDCGPRKSLVRSDCVIKKEPDHCVETKLRVKGNHRQIRCAETVAAEVEIIDSDMIVKRRILSPFVPNKLHCSMFDEDSRSHGVPSASDVFRKEVMKALRKPYDKREHQKHRETIRIGSYLKSCPSLRRILTEFRYQRMKRLIIIRGFLFWLQNLTREGAFCPWEDEECLAVDISSPDAQLESRKLVISVARL